MVLTIKEFLPHSDGGLSSFSNLDQQQESNNHNSNSTLMVNAIGENEGQWLERDRVRVVCIYICGFGGLRRDLHYYIERKWKEKRDGLIQYGEMDTCMWARCADSIISRISNDNENNVEISPSALSLVLLFDDSNEI